MTSRLSVALGYLVGSIPFGFFVARRRGGVDIRRTGSGNGGATSVIRNAGVRAGLMTAALDVAKGASAAAVAGHAYPVWLGFRGGVRQRLPDPVHPPVTPGAAADGIRATPGHVGLT